MASSDITSLPINACNRRLLALRGQLFGSHVDAVGTCPACGDESEIAFSLEPLLDTQVRSERLRFTWRNQQLELRPLTTQDLLDAQALPLERARRHLAGQCVMISTESALPADPQQWDDELIDLIEEQLVGADPLAEIELCLSCPICGAAWTVRLDIADYLSREVDIWVKQLLRDVAVLARAFGWHEKEILRLPAWRREFYLETLTS